MAGRLARWSILISEYRLKIVYKSGKTHTDADALSRYPVDGPEEFDDEDFLLLIGSTAERNDELSEAQRSVPRWAAAIERLSAAPASTCGNFLMKNDLLFMRTFKNGDYFDRLCLPPGKFRTEVLLANHDDVTAGHLGLKRTLTKMRCRYYWPKMSKSVQEYVQSCENCQARKSPQKKPAGFMQYIEVEYPFEKVGIDLLGPFPVSVAGNVHIIVAVDYLTKWCETKAVPTATAVEVANFVVEQLILRHGTPRSLVSDQGKCFMSRLMKAVLNKLGVEHRPSTPFHQQANGLVERTNHVLADMLSMYVDGEHKLWDEALPFVTFAYNVSKQESTGFSPFYLVNCREAILPIDAALATNPNAVVENCASPEYADRIQKLSSEAREWVKSKLLAAHQRQKRAYDEGRSDAAYAVGDLVLVYKPIRKIGRAEKLLHRWLGPFVVIRRISDLNYEIKRLNAVKSEIIHVAALKPYHRRTENFVQQEEAEDIAKKKQYRPMPVLEEKTAEEIEDEPAIDSLTQRGVKFPEGSSLTTVEDSAQQGVMFQESDGQLQNNGLSQQEITPAEDVTNSTCIFPDTNAPVQIDNENLRRSTRPTRGKHSRFLLCLSLFYGCMFFTRPAKAAGGDVIERGGVFFREEAQISFSDSSWTIVTDLPLQEYGNLFDDSAAILQKSSSKIMQLATNSEFETRLRARIRGGVNDRVDRLELLRTKFDDLTNSVAPRGRRSRRGAFNFGGKILHWLFGVPAQADLERVSRKLNNVTKRTAESAHLAEVQATLVSEALKESHMTLQGMRNLSAAYSALSTSLKTMTTNSAFLANQTDEKFKLLLDVDYAFDDWEINFSRLSLLVQSIEFGLLAAARGQLAVDLLPPPRLNRILNEISSVLPSGWALAAEIADGNIWNVYREAKVLTAATDTGLRIFIQLPVIESQLTFTLFRIFALPLRDPVNSTSFVIKSLPDYLAVSATRQEFAELATQEIGPCIEKGAYTCRMHKALNRKWARVSCAVGLFLSDPSRQANECQLQMVNWNGPETIYIGNRQWAYSTVKPQTFHLQCAAKSGNKPRVMDGTLAGVGIFEIPPGCSAHTDDWIYPASYSQVSNAGGPVVKKVNMSDLPVQVLTANQPTQVTSLTTEDPRWVEQLAANEAASATAAENVKTASTIRIAADGLVSDGRYPLELAVVLGALAMCMIAAAYLFFTQVWPKLLLLERRMSQLEQPEQRAEGHPIPKRRQLAEVGAATM